MLELWGMRNTPSMPSLPGLLWPGVEAPGRILSIGQIELKCVLKLNWIVWNRTVLTFNCLSAKTIFILNWIVWNLIQHWINRKRLIRHKSKQLTNQLFFYVIIMLICLLTYNFTHFYPIFKQIYLDGKLTLGESGPQRQRRSDYTIDASSQDVISMILF